MAALRQAGKSYRCGWTTAEALDGFLAASRPTKSRQVDRDRYGRVVADCWRADGSNVNVWLLRRGHALDWPRYSRGKYATEQAAARREKAGVWQGDFIEPWEARKARSQ
ncbi:thermonuclease family protein [Pseudaminobacter soli (ex Zhang et al. 2022)]|uniref:thermonuclease family protein n=1 Tax=Pseudaminobacter soli (ex Zhang et al. 2022) TaxID=2831468 RepID=UPI003CC7F2E0